MSQPDENLQGGGSFRCPQCGATEPDSTSLDQPLDPTDQWQGILPTVRCSRCRLDIPAHLAWRWHGMSFQQAQQEWRRLYNPWGNRDC